MPYGSQILLWLNTSFALPLLLKATLTLMLVLVAVRCAHHSRASVRHAIVAAGFAALMLLPVAALIAPPLRIPVSLFASQPQPLRMSPIMASSPQSLIQANASSVSPSQVPPLTEIAFAVWCAGACLFLLPMFVGIGRIRSIRREALPWEHGHSEAAALAQNSGCTRRVAVALHPAAPGSMTCGIISPIVLPQDAVAWSGADLIRALAHELKHVRRWNFLTHCLARTVAAAYWFHPLVWVAWRRLTLEEERACDDAVLAHSGASAYADQLLALAKRLSAAARPPLLAMAARAELSQRIRAVLNESQLRGRASRKALVALTAATLVILASAPLTLTVAAQTPQTAAGADALGRFRSETRLVIETVTAHDSNNNPIGDLKADDFLVTEDGIPQHVAFASYQPSEALHVFDGVRSYYVIGYYSANRNPAIQFHKIAITLNNGRFGKLDYRTGYDSESRLAGATNPPTSVSPRDPTLQRPEITRKVEPAYAEEARKAKYQGTVTLAIHIDATGAVTAVTVKRALGLGLDEEAQRAAMQWKFAPARRAGVPIESDAEIEMVFRLL